MSKSSSFVAPDGAALCLGVFDGVHKGHQALIARCVSEASQRGLVPLVHSFEPHPAAFFRRQADHYLLTLPNRRSELLRDLGIAHAIYAEFNMQFAQQTPTEFLDHLVAHHHAKLVVTGPDYRFGKDRLGDVSSLRSDGRFEVVKSAMGTGFFIHKPKLGGPGNSKKTKKYKKIEKKTIFSKT